MKFHFKTNQGIKNLSGPQAARLSGTDPDYATRDLFNAIDKGDFPSWTLFIQVRQREIRKTIYIYIYIYLHILNAYMYMNIYLLIDRMKLLNTLPEHHIERGLRSRLLAVCPFVSVSSYLDMRYIYMYTRILHLYIYI